MSATDIDAMPGQPATGEIPSRPPDDLLRSERSMIVVRWAGALFAALQVVAYDDVPYPPDLPVYRLALVATGILALGNGLAWLAARRRLDRREIVRLSVATLALDGVVAMSFVWLWSFDASTALWAVLFILPMEGAIKFQLPGALWTWMGITIAYAAREFWRVEVFPETTEVFPLLWNSISFRMGIGLMIALVAGFMARNLTRQKALVEATVRRLRQVDRIRSTLVSTLAHDVRSPIGAIRTTFAMILSKGERLDAATTKELLAGADRQAARLQHLAADLLDLARLERGRLELSLADVPLLHAVEQSVAYLAEGDRFEIEIDPSIVVRADARRLEQIVVNLASNALRHGKPPFRIEARMREEALDLLFLDRGPGVSMEARETLFEPFRAEGSDSSVGFGLAIVKALAEAHGGDVTYSDNHPAGACFTLRLPQATTRATEPAGA